MAKKTKQEAQQERLSLAEKRNRQERRNKKSRKEREQEKRRFNWQVQISRNV